jgi:GTP-binding protein
MNHQSVISLFPSEMERPRPNVLKIRQCEFVDSVFHLDKLPRDRRPQIAFAGRSNVGKSTLLNRLVGHRKMAKVSKSPGKTRSLNFFLVNERFYFVDLPGYGYARVSKTERAGWGKLIEGFLHGSETLAGLVLLLDCRREPSGEDHQLLSWLHESRLPTLIVVTKADKLNRDKVHRKLRQVENELGLPSIAFSSVSGEGKNELLAAIGDLITVKPQ